MSEQIAMYKGRPATDLTRDELIEAYTKLCHDIVDLRRLMVEHAALEREIAECQRVLASKRPI